MPDTFVFRLMNANADGALWAVVDVLPESRVRELNDGETYSSKYANAQTLAQLAEERDLPDGDYAHVQVSHFNRVVLSSRRTVAGEAIEESGALDPADAARPEGVE